MVAVDLDSSDSQATNDPDTPWRRDQAWGWGSQPATDLQDDTPTVSRWKLMFVAQNGNILFFILFY
jgi:hypothetical protein